MNMFHYCVRRCRDEDHHEIKHNRPEIVVIMPGERNWQPIDIAIPQYHNIESKENDKVNKRIDLASIIRTKHKVKTEIAPRVIGGLGSVSETLRHTLMLLVSQIYLVVLKSPPLRALIEF